MMASLQGGLLMTWMRTCVSGACRGRRELSARSMGASSRGICLPTTRRSRQGLMSQVVSALMSSGGPLLGPAPVSCRRIGIIPVYPADGPLFLGNNVQRCLPPAPTNVTYRAAMSTRSSPEGSVSAGSRWQPTSLRMPPTSPGRGPRPSGTQPRPGRARSAQHRALHLDTGHGSLPGDPPRPHLRGLAALPFRGNRRLKGFCMWRDFHRCFMLYRSSRGQTSN
jgi:hypothetical protein